MLPILVGYDGSDGADRALSWAVREAERRHVGLTVLQSWHEPILSDRTSIERWDDLGFARREAGHALQRVADRAVAGRPGVTCASLVVSERPAASLVAAASSYQLVVVGSRGRGGVSDLVLGSVAEQVASSSPVTVVIVRGSEHEGGAVVVGVDGSSESRRALRWAVSEGRARSCSVCAVLAWTPLAPIGVHGATPFGAAATDADAQMALHHIVVEEIGRPQMGRVGQASVSGPAAKTIVDAAARAALVVLGAPGGLEGRHHHLGAVARQVIRRAPCPVVIAR